MFKRFVSLLTVCAMAVGAQPAGAPTASQVIDQIKAHVGVPWQEPTVDTFKAGNPDTVVTGIATTMMATLDVLKRAAASGDNLVITHEPTFYGHLDQTADFEKERDAVWAEKEAFIKQHNLVVWRFHDYWHQRRPDGILEGMTQAIGWKKFQSASNPALFVLPETTLVALAGDLKKRLGIRVLRVVGDPQMKVTEVGLRPGAAGFAPQRAMLQRPDVQVLVIGEVPEWETIEYVTDAVSEGRHKALVLLGHIPSEQAGMKDCAEWLKTFVQTVPVHFVPTAEPFWMPE